MKGCFPQPSLLKLIPIRERAQHGRLTQSPQKQLCQNSRQTGMCLSGLHSLQTGYIGKYKEGNTVTRSGIFTRHVYFSVAFVSYIS